eukprot:Selendium_serpulae@DN7924_c0_g1_i1.p1
MALDTKVTEPMLTDSAVPFTCSLIHRHRQVGELVSTGCAALAMMNKRLVIHQKALCDQIFVASVIASGKKFCGQQFDVETNINCFICAACEFRENAQIRSMLAKHEALSFSTQTVNTVVKDTNVLKVACRAVGVLVYKEKRAINDSLKLKTVSAILHVVAKFPKNILFIREALYAIANLIRDSAKNSEFVDKRAVDTIIKAFKGCVPDQEVAKSTCRIFASLRFHKNKVYDEKVDLAVRETIKEVANGSSSMQPIREELRANFMALLDNKERGAPGAAGGVQQLLPPSKLGAAKV